MKRRDFLWASLAAGGGAAATFGGLAPFLRMAHAGEEGADRYYVFCYFGGGWDILLSLDPRDPNTFTTDRLGETLIQPGYELLQDDDNDGSLVDTKVGITFGPYIGDMRAHADKIAVVRGMSMETLTHEAGLRRFLTGKPPSGLLARGSSASTWLAGTLGEDELIPNLSVRVESYNINFPSYASALKVQSVPDLVDALRPTDSLLADPEKAALDALLSEASQCSLAVRSPFWQQAESGRQRAKQMVASNLYQLFDFNAATPEMEALRSHYGIPLYGSLDSPQAQAAMAATALTSGVSRVVSIMVAGGLDTHYSQWRTDQGPFQEVGFNAVARLVEDLASRPYQDTGDTWLDHTTIVGFSEFSRTSLLNTSTGRDHSLTNACFLLGAGIQGGVVVGRSSDIGMAPTTTNLETGESDPGGDVIRPEHIIRALFVDAGITEDVADLRVEPLSAILR
jgi:hypothetical protein